MQDLIERAENYRKNLKVFKLDKFEEFTFEEVPSDLDDIDSTLEGIFNTNDSLTDDTSIYNKDEEN